MLGPAAAAQPAKQPQKAIDPSQYVLPGIKDIAASPPDSETPKSDSSEAASTVESEAGAAKANQAKAASTVFEESEVTTPAFVVMQPEPDYSEAARNSRIEGIVKLKGALNPSGKVSRISVIEGLPHGLTEKAMQAFRHLKFIPALKDDARVAQWVTVEYHFSLD